MAKEKHSTPAKPDKGFVTDRVKGSVPATRILDNAMRSRRGLKMQLPPTQIPVDPREARRAIRWGRAEDERVVALDQAMKNRREVGRAVESMVRDGTLTRRQGPPVARDHAADKTRGVVLGVVVVGVIIVMVLMILFAGRLM